MLRAGKYPNIDWHLFYLSLYSKVRESQMKFKEIFNITSLLASLNLNFITCKMAIVVIASPYLPELCVKWDNVYKIVFKPQKNV